MLHLIYSKKAEQMDTADLEANREKSEVVVKNQEVPNEEAEMETVGALKNQYGDRRLAVRRRGRPKKRTEGDGESR
jgi:hypothetical protein